MAALESFSAQMSALGAHLDVGDARLEKRVIEMVSASLGGDGSSLARLFGPARRVVKGAQRLLSNERVEVEALRSALHDVTADEIQRLGARRVVAAFDPSELDFTWHDAKGDRRAIGDGRGLGYEWDNCVAIDPTSGRLLGVLHQALVTEDGPDDAHLYDYAEGAQKRSAPLLRRLGCNPKQRFLTQMHAVDRRLPEECEVVFVADREFDDGLVVRARGQLGKNRHLIIRANGSRAVQVHDAPWLPAKARRNQPRMPYRLSDGQPAQGLIEFHLKEIIPFLPLAPLRDVPLDTRGRVSLAGAAHRKAALSAGAIPIRIVTASKRGRHGHFNEESTWINLVIVREAHPPKGSRPLSWMLLTDLPVDTLENVGEIVDLYLCRWRIEEFFRTTKDALAIEESKLDDAAALARLLFFITMKAIFLDSLRADAQMPAGRVPTTTERRTLVAAAAQAEMLEQRRASTTPRSLPRLTRRDRALMLLGLVATKGGWLGRSNDHLGNYVLLRGLHWLLSTLRYGPFAWLVGYSGEVGS